MPASAITPTLSPSSTRPKSTACTVSVLAKVLPTAKFLSENRCKSSSIAPICASAPLNAQSTKVRFGSGSS